MGSKVSEFREQWEENRGMLGKRKERKRKRKREK